MSSWYVNGCILGSIGLPWLDAPTIVDSLEQCQRLRQEALSEHIREAVKALAVGNKGTLVQAARNARSVAHGPNHCSEDSAAEFIGSVLDNFRQHAGYQDMLVQTLAVDMEAWVTGYNKQTGAAVEERAFDRGDFFEHILMCEQSVQSALGQSTSNCTPTHPVLYLLAGIDKILPQLPSPHTTPHTTPHRTVHCTAPHARACVRCRLDTAGPR